jgi:hypothetical protein
MVEEDCIVSLRYKGGDNITHSYSTHCIGLFQVGVW